MSWQDRIQPTIVLTSPSKRRFEAMWVGDPRDKAKRLGIHEYPDASGAVVQDMGIGPDRRAITLYFEGRDHDLQAQAFYGALNESGVWEIEHPRDGLCKLQLVTVTEEIQPVTSANATQFKTEWIEPGLDLALAAISVPELANTVTMRADELDTEAAAAFAGHAATDELAYTTQIRAVTQRLLAISSAVSAQRQTVLARVTEAAGATLALAGAVRDMVQTPALQLRDTASRMAYYERAIEEANSITHDAEWERMYAAMQELVTNAALSGIAQTVAEADFSTREEALSYLERVQTAFRAARDSMDRVQAQYAEQRVDEQFLTATDTAGLEQAVTELILRRSFDLSAARRITLQSARCPVEIAFTEGVDLDRFIAYNHLKGDEILLLPAGRQVVVFQ